MFTREPYDFTGQIRDKNISKVGFAFSSVWYFEDKLKTVEVLIEKRPFFSTSMKSYSLSGFFEPDFSLLTLLHYLEATAVFTGLFATAPFDLLFAFIVIYCISINIYIQQKLTRSNLLSLILLSKIDFSCNCSSNNI